jgi:hypothetical protein
MRWLKAIPPPSAVLLNGVATGHVVTRTCARAELFSLFSRRSPLAYREYLAATVRATVRAGMVRKPRLMALRTNLQLRNLNFVMLTPMTLSRVGLAFLR